MQSKPLFTTNGFDSRNQNNQPRSQRRSFAASMGLFTMLFMACGMDGSGCISLPIPESSPGVASKQLGGTPRPVVLNSDHILGDPNAPITIVQYEDLSNNNCGKFARGEFPSLEAEYIETGLVRWVFRQYPSNGSAQATPSARALECADDQDAYFDYRDLVYDTTDANGSTLLSDATLQDHADSLGLDTTEFDACFTSQSKTARIQQDVNSANSLGFSSLPAFFVEDEVVSGFQSAEGLAKIIDRHLMSP